MEKNSIVIDMIDRSSKDFEFRDQIKKAKTETKEFINAIIKTFEMIDLKRKHSSAHQIAIQLKQ